MNFNKKTNSSSETDIDVKRLLIEVLNTREREEGIDEALLRVCKQMYPEIYASLFSSITLMLNSKSDKESAIREMIKGNTKLRFKVSTKRSSWGTSNKEFKCDSCGYSSEIRHNTCPRCFKTQRKSFLGKILKAFKL